MIYETYTIGGEIYHARDHKYIDKIRTKNGKWRYIHKIAKARKALREADLPGAINAYGRMSDAEVNRFGAKGYEALNKFGRNATQNLRNFDRKSTNEFINFGGNDPFFKSSNDKARKELAEREKVYAKDIANLRGNEIASRNEAKIEARNKERARRDMATAVGDKNAKAIKEGIDSAKKLVYSILNKKRKR